MFGPGDGVIGNVAAILEDGSGNHLYTETFLSETSFNVGAISSIADFEAQGAVLGGGVFHFAGTPGSAFGSSQVERADGGFSFGDAQASIDVDFANRTVGGGDSYLSVSIADSLISYSFNTMEFLNAVSFDDASNGAGVFGFDGGDFSGANVENALLLIRDGGSGAGETADVYFNFNDGMGGEGTGVIEMAPLEPSATDY